MNGASSKDRVGNLQPVLPIEKTEKIQKKPVPKKRARKKVKRIKGSADSNPIEQVGGSSPSRNKAQANSSVDRQPNPPRGNGTGQGDASKDGDRANSGSKGEVENESEHESDIEDAEDIEDVEDHPDESEEDDD